jgi:hypothetical protein
MHMRSKFNRRRGYVQSIDYDLADFIKIYAQENRTTASEVITQFVLGLKRRTCRQSTDAVLLTLNFLRPSSGLMTRRIEKPF